MKRSNYSAQFIGINRAYQEFKKSMSGSLYWGAGGGPVVE